MYGTSTDTSYRLSSARPQFDCSVKLWPASYSDKCSHVWRLNCEHGALHLPLRVARTSTARHTTLEL
eukprot:5399221-Pleurochrysis_carterae.AAC.3